MGYWDLEDDQPTDQRTSGPGFPEPQPPTDPNYPSWGSEGWGQGQIDPATGLPRERPGSTPPQTATTPTQAAGTSEAGRVYQPYSGWDVGKLNAPERSGPRPGGGSFAKYDFLRTVQNTGITAQQARGRLGHFTNDPTLRRLYPNMRAVGDDKIDFGDGYGAVDVITSGGQWSWGVSGGAGDPRPGSPGARPPGYEYLDRPGGTAGLTGALDPRGGRFAVSGGPGVPGAAPQFTDPLTRQYEAMLQQQREIYDKQRQAWEAEQTRGQTVREQTAAASKRLEDYLNQRIGKLQGPAYTGSELEVLRTQQLDPIERDRQAAKARALEEIANRGMDPTSGIAQELLNQVDRGFDQMRAGAQGDLGYAQIQEERSRQQEAQELLSLLTQLPMAGAQGDIGLIQTLYDAANRAGQGGLDLGQILADLPVQRTRFAHEMAGVGGQRGSGQNVQELVQLLQMEQRRRAERDQQTEDYWASVGG